VLLVFQCTFIKLLLETSLLNAAVSKVVQLRQLIVVYAVITEISQQLGQFCSLFLALVDLLEYFSLELPITNFVSLGH
jgi:hypothetical protein